MTLTHLNGRRAEKKHGPANLAEKNVLGNSSSLDPCKANRAKVAIAGDAYSTMTYGYSREPRALVIKETCPKYEHKVARYSQLNRAV